MAGVVGVVGAVGAAVVALEAVEAPGRVVVALEAPGRVVVARPDEVVGTTRTNVDVIDVIDVIDAEGCGPGAVGRGAVVETLMVLAVELGGTVVTGIVVTGIVVAEIVAVEMVAAGIAVDGVVTGIEGDGVAFPGRVVAGAAVVGGVDGRATATADRPSVRSRRCSRAVSGRRRIGATGTAPPVFDGSIWAREDGVDEAAAEALLIGEPTPWISGTESAISSTLTGLMT